MSGGSPSDGEASTTRRTVRLRRLKIANVGTLRGTLDLGPLADRLTLVTGRNEAGKSTLVEALRAALFERHAAAHQGLRSLQPHGSKDGPEVWLELQLDGETVELHKRFLAHPLAELTRADGTMLVGDEAEAWLQGALEARAPGRKGAKLADMGVWGLLWVTQDEAAFGDPGTQLDPSVKGAFQEAIARQVSTAVGGRHAERLRARVAEEARRYWTAAAGRATGELAQADEALNEADARVRELERLVRDGEEHADAFAAAEQALRRHRDERPGLEAARRHAEVELAAFGERARALQARGAALEAAVAARQAREAEAARRAAAVRAVEAAQAQLDEATARAQAVAEALEPVVAEAQTVREAEAEADAQLREARRAQAEAERREAAAAAGEARQARRERRAQAAAALLAVWKAAAEVADAPSDDARRAWQAAAARVREAEARAAAHATRLRWWREGDEGDAGEVVHDGYEAAVTVALAGEGTLQLIGGRPGLARARRREAEAHRRLEEAQRALGLDVGGLEGGGLAEARQARRRRAAFEAESVALEARWEEVSRAAWPKGRGPGAGGPDALAEEVARARAAAREARRIVGRVEAYASAASDAARARDEEGATPERVARVEASVRATEAACQSAAAFRVRLEVAATRPGLTVAPEHGDAGALPPGEIWQTEASSAGPVVATVGADGEPLLIVTARPAGREAEEAASLIAAHEAVIAAGLEEAGLSDLEALRASAERWRIAEAARLEAEAALKALAPRGLEVARREAVGADRRAAELEAASEAAAAGARVTAALEASPATAARVGALEEAVRALAAAQASTRDLAAAVTWSDGARVQASEPARWQRGPWRITLTPGEVPEQARAEGVAARAALQAALGDASLEARDEAWAAGLTARERQRAHEAAWRGLGLGALPPPPRPAAGPVASLEAEASRWVTEQLGAEEPPGEAPSAGEPAGAEGALQEVSLPLDALRRAVDEAEAAVRGWRDAAEQASQRVAALREERAGAASRVEAAAAARSGAAAELAAQREVRSDDAVEASVEAARAREADARAALDLAVAGALEPSGREVAAALAEAAHARAGAALEAHDARDRALSDERSRLSVVLEQAASRGAFEQLQLARSEAEVRRSEAARIRRRAAAAKALEGAVASAYDAAQARFLAPVVEEATPYLARIRPGSALRMTSDLKLDRLVREGAEERFDQLSGGTREQLSVIVRLALARVLARDGRALPLILDDTMGWTDDVRFERVAEILRHASRELQVLVLTCHPERFTRLGADRVVDLDRLKREQGVG